MSLSDKILYNENEGWQYHHFKASDVKAAVQELQEKWKVHKELGVGNIVNALCVKLNHDIKEIFGEQLT